MVNFSPIAGTWDKPVYLIGGGDSLRGFDFDRLNGLGITVGINKAAWLLNTDVFFTLDQHLAKMHRNEIAQFIKDGGDAYLALPTNTDLTPIDGAHYIIKERNSGIHPDPMRVTGVNSGYAALGLAYHKKAREIALLGYDMAKGDHTHWHGGYPWHATANHRYYDKWASNFDKAKLKFDEAGTSIVNFVGTPKSKIDSFQVSSLNDL